MRRSAAIIAMTLFAVAFGGCSRKPAAESRTEGARPKPTAVQSSGMPESAAISIAESQYGPVRDKRNKQDYFVLKVKLISKVATTLTFKQNDCVLSDANGKEYPDCWYAIVGASAGVSERRSAPIAMMDYSLTDPVTGTPISLDAAKVDGPQGELTYGLPANGFVQLRLLWPVSPQFEPGKAKLAGVGEVMLQKR